MTKLLKKAFDEAAQLPEEEQDAIASWLLAEIESEAKWSEAFARSADKLSELAEEALQEYAAGRTKPLDPDSL